jgi:hypothetical protein
MRRFKLDGFKPSSLGSDMARAERAVLEILFPQVRAELLRALFGVPRQQRYVRELMAITGLAMHTVQDELRKLSAMRLVVSWSNGYHRFYRAHRGHVLFPHLREIVRLSERLPKTKHSVLRRAVGQPRRTKRGRLRRAAMGPSRPPGWGLFKMAQRGLQTRRL